MSELTLRLSARDCRLVTCDRPEDCPRSSDCRLTDLAAGTTARIATICPSTAPELARRLFDLGFVPGAPITLRRRAPFGGPLVISVADYEIALRGAQAQCIRVWPQAA